MCICRLHRQVQTQEHPALEPEVVVLVACSKSWQAGSLLGLHQLTAPQPLSHLCVRRRRSMQRSTTAT
jgi:hypothetical protein